MFVRFLFFFPPFCLHVASLSSYFTLHHFFRQLQTDDWKRIHIIITIARTTLNIYSQLTFRSQLLHSATRRDFDDRFSHLRGLYATVLGGSSLDKSAVVK